MVLKPNYVPWSQFRALFFDVDGTLYGQWPLWWRMLQLILRSNAPFSLARKLYVFRRLRRHYQGQRVPGLARVEYDWAAAALGTDRAALGAELHAWLHEYPLPYLKESMFTAVAEVFDMLRKKGKQIGVLSDYPAEKKLQALNLEADAVLHAAHPEVEALKPHPRGLEQLLATLQIQPSEALYIGNSIKKDGTCAAAAQIPFMHVWPGRGNTFYRALLRSLHAYKPK